MSARNMFAKTFKITAFISMLALGGYTNAENALNAKNYTCHDLQQLIIEKERVVLRGFLGSTNPVFASRESCGRYKKPLWTAWRTQDRFSCPVGFRCLFVGSRNNGR